MDAFELWTAMFQSRSRGTERPAFNHSSDVSIALTLSHASDPYGFENRLSLIIVRLFSRRPKADRHISVSCHTARRTDSSERFHGTPNQENQVVYYSKEQQENDHGTRHHDHGGGHHGKRRRSSRAKLVVALGTALAIETVLLLTAYGRMSIAEQENADLVLAERKQAQELELLRPQVQKLKTDIAAMAQSRLPGLSRLEFDQVIAVDQDYVKNIVFTAAGKGEEKHYEYKIVMHNATLNLIHPQVDILFFDPLGIQVGLSRLGVQKDGTPTLEMLDRGEIRSFSSRIELTDKIQPEYFRLKIWK